MIEKFFFALASVLVFEGLILAVMPSRIKKAIQLMATFSSSSLSGIGLLLMMIGIIFMAVIDI